MCQLRLPQLSEIIEKEPDRFKDIQGNILENIKQNGDSQLNDLCLDGDALRFIKNYEWPGNVRQLHHVLMLSALNANFEKRNVITADDLTAQLSDAGVPQVFEEKVGNREIPSNIENWLNERKNYFMKRLYEECHGNISEIAKRSGMSYQKVQYFYKASVLKLFYAPVLIRAVNMLCSAVDGTALMKKRIRLFSCKSKKLTVIAVFIIVPHTSRLNSRNE